MAAVYASTSCDLLREATSLDQKIPPSKTGSDDGNGEREADYMFTTRPRRCDNFCREQDACCAASTLTLSWPPRDSKTFPTKHIYSLELIESTEHITPRYGTAPPSYHDAILDIPPDYSTSESLAQVKRLHDSIHYLGYSLHYDRTLIETNSFKSMTLPINLNDTSNFQSHAGATKRNKKAAAAANRAKWEAGSGDEDKGNGGDGEENAGGGADGGSNHGDGGAGDDGGDDWDYGNKKKGKKGKKGKNNVEEEEEKQKKEEEKKRREEEEEKNKQEEKNKKEEDAANGTAGDPLSWAEGGDANGDDSWGGVVTKKGKKGKKEKEKEKKPNNVPLAQDISFDNIDLGDGALKLDLDFGTSSTKDTASGFSLGGWGSVWGAQSKDTKSTDVSEGNAWSFGGNKKNINKTTTSAFEFGDSTTLDEKKEESLNPITEDSTKLEEEDAWTGDFMSVNKKDKKNKKKGIIEDFSRDLNPPIIDVPITDPVDTTGDSFGWGPVKKEKKGKLNNVPPVPPPPPAMSTLPVVEEEWGTFGNKKKKGKKNFIDETPKADEVISSTYLDLEGEANDGWPTFNGLNKKKGKRDHIEDIKQVEEKPVAVDVPESKSAVDDLWDTFPSKKERKGSKAMLEDPKVIDDFAATVVPETDLGRDDTLGTWGTTSKKNKKGKKGGITEVVEDPIVPPLPVAAVEATGFDDDWINTGSAKKKDKKGDKAKKGIGTEAKMDKPLPPPTSVAAAIDSFDMTNDDFWDNSKEEKDNKVTKGGSGFAETLLPDTTPESSANRAEEEWAASLVGLSVRERKKKERERERAKAKEELEEEERHKEEERKKEEEKQREEEEEKQKKEKEADKKKETEKKKGGKKGVFEVAEDSKAKDLLSGSTADVAEDTWGTNIWEPTKKTKAGGKTNSGFEAPPPAPTPPAMGLTPEPELELDNLPENDWGSFAPVKSKEKPKKGSLTRTISTSKVTEVKDSKAARKTSVDKSNDLFSTLDEYSQEKVIDDVKDTPIEEMPAKAAKGYWGAFGGMTATKSKVSKDKEREEKAKKEAEKQAEKEAAEKEAAEKEAAEKEAENVMMFQLTDDVDEIPVKLVTKKGNVKAKAGSKLNRVNSKEDKTNKAPDETKNDGMDALIDIVEEAGPETSRDIKDKTTDVKEQKGDAWSFWGTSKKPGGNKGDEPKKEITKIDVTNQKAAKSSLNEMSNQPEELLADEATQPWKTSKFTSKMPPTTNTTKSLFATSKATGTLSVSEKVKALEKERLKKSETRVNVVAPPPPPPAPIAPEPLPQADSPPKKVSALTKSKTASATKTATLSKKKDLSPPPKDEQKASKESVPGSFPSEGAEDDIIDLLDLSQSEEKVIKKSTKSPKEKAKEVKEVKEAKDAKNAKMDSFLVEAPAPPAPPAPPTPPPEPVVSKPVKKERARVVGNEGASSWGIWGTAPKKNVKKEVKSKDDADTISPPSKAKASTPGLNRSKSTRIPREKEREELSRSSGSDKEKKVESRPPKSRGASFSGLFGGPSPARARSVRRSSNVVPKSSSRRQSVDVGALGMPSPPPDDPPEIHDKAAKVLGTAPGKLGRKESIGGKRKPSVVPDPYAIDDDDMVLVHGIEDPVINAPIPTKASTKDISREKLSRSKSKREVGGSFVYPQQNDSPLADRTKSSRLSRPNELAANRTLKRDQSKYVPEPSDDIVMVEAGPSNDGADVITGPEDLAFVEKPREPPPLKRSATSAKKSDGIKGLFGSFRKTRPVSETRERSRANDNYRDNDGPTRRKRPVAAEDDSAKRLRRDERKIRRSDRPDRLDVDGDGFATDAAPRGGGSTEAEDAEARREERRAKRESKDRGARERRAVDTREEEERKARDQLTDKAATEARKAKIRELRDKNKEDEDREVKRQEDREARRTTREDRYTDEGQARELDDQPTPIERRSKRRDRDRDPISDIKESSRPQRSDRRRSHLDKPIPSRIATEEAERRARHEERRSRRTSTTPAEKPSSSRRSTAPPVEDYFDARNGARDTEPVLHPITGATDHTSSWVNSQITEPPLAPPIEPTVIEPPPVLGEGGPIDGVDEFEDIRRAAKRRASRRRKHGDVGGGEEEGRRRRRDRDREREREVRSSEGSGEYKRGRREYAGAFTGTRPVPAKRESWFKKIGL